MGGLRQLGVTIIECRDASPGLLKYWRLWNKHRAIAKSGGYDAIIVGYPGHIVVPLARILVLRGKPVIADLLGSLTDAGRHSHHAGSLHIIKLRIIDWLAVRFADRILLESASQKKYFEREFGMSDKYAVVYTGVDEEVFSEHASKADRRSVAPGRPFTVFFRGKLTPECGIGHILFAAELLKDEPAVKFKIIGKGYLLPQAERLIKEKGLSNVELESRYLSSDEMRRSIQEASLYLGQFEDNDRLKRTIPHKAFEAFAAGIPYLSAEAPAIQELVTEGETGFLVPKEDGRMIADKIRFLWKNPDLLAKVSRAARKMYEEKLSSVKLAARIVEVAQDQADPFSL